MAKINLFNLKKIILRQAPSFTIAANAGADASLVVGKLLEQDDLNLGYDAARGLSGSSTCE